MRRIWLAALGACVVGYTAAVAAIIIERPYDAPNYVASLNQWFHRSEPTILVIDLAEQSRAHDNEAPLARSLQCLRCQISPIVFRDDESCERSRLATAADDHAFCMPLAFIH